MNFSTSSAVFPWRPAAWLRVSGEDAESFLQGQFTNDLRKLTVAKGGAVYGLWLTVKGKVLADSFVLRGAAGEFWVGSYFSPAEVIRERLESFVIADDVVIEEQTAAWSAVTVWGEGSGAAVEAEARALGVGVVFGGRRGREENVEWVFPVEKSAAVRARLEGAMVGGEGEREQRRIAARIAAVPVDVGPGDLPGEGDLESVAISYTKGCYLGQEVMARLKAMGQVRRRLLRVAGAGAAPGGLPAALFIGERKVGEVRSAVSGGAEGWVGLAMLSLLHLSGDATLAFAAGGEAVVRLVDTP
jgi:folate-binding protein YgfZ